MTVSSNPARRGSFWAFLIVGALIFVGAFAAFYYRQQSGNDPNGMLSRQHAGESIAGKNATTSDKRTESGRAEEIQKTETPNVSLTAEQKQRLSNLLKGEQQARRDSAEFTLSIGATVPRQIALADLPDTAADILHGYNGDKYLIIGDQLVIVDRDARRIVALIPNIG